MKCKIALITASFLLSGVAHAGVRFSVDDTRLVKPQEAGVKLEKFMKGRQDYMKAPYFGTHKQKLRPVKHSARQIEVRKTVPARVQEKIKTNDSPINMEAGKVTAAVINAVKEIFFGKK